MGLIVERSLAPAFLPARLQLLVNRARTTGQQSREPGCGAGEVGVIAQVLDLNACQRSADFRPGQVVAPTRDGGGYFVTGRVALARAARFLAEKHVARVEVAAPLTPLLEEAKLELGAQPSLLADAQSNLGANAWIGCIDSAVDWSHGNLMDAEGRPRIAAYWQQAARTRRDARVDYGAVWGQRELALYAEATQGDRAVAESHGLQMLDVAAGNGRSSGAAGIAPRAKLVHVDLSRGRNERHRLGDTVRLLEGMKFAFDVAGPEPCAVNVSLGTNAGPHDGSTLVEQAMDALVSAAPGRAVAIAAGNGYAADQHASFDLSSGDTFDLSWYLPPTKRGRHAVELWFGPDEQVDLELNLPRRMGKCRLPLRRGCRLVDEQSGRTRAVIAHETSPVSGDRSVTIYLERGAPAGVWTVRLRPRGKCDSVAHAWITPEDDVTPVFLTGSDESCTLNAIACGRATLAIGALDARREQLPLGWYSSAGPTRDGRSKPDLSAPGHRLQVTAAKREESSIECSGTSLAAAAATGVAALALGRAAQLGLRLNALELRQLLIRCARANPPVIAWDDRYGWGRMDAAMAIAAVEQIALAAR